MLPHDTAKLLTVAAWMRKASEWIEGEVEWSRKDDEPDEDDKVETVFFVTTELDSFIANLRRAGEILESIKIASPAVGEAAPYTEVGP